MRLKPLVLLAGLCLPMLSPVRAEDLPPGMTPQMLLQMLVTRSAAMQGNPQQEQAAPLPAACDNAVATIVVQGADMVSRITCTPTSAAPGTTVTCTATCTNNGPAPAVNAVCTILNVAGLPAGASTPVCPGSPAASLPAGATLACTVTFPMPPLSSISIAAGAAADNDALGGSDPAAVNNNASSVSFGALLSVPALDGLAFALLALLLAGVGFSRVASRHGRRG